MKSTEAQVGGCTLHPVVRQFVCILNNCESVVIWAFNRSSAEVECREKYGEPVHTWATKRQFCTTPSALEKARLFGDIQTSMAASNYKPNPGHHAEPRLGGNSVDGVVGGTNQEKP
jgi:hypothetical protein